MEWYLKVLRNYAVFSGRARRKEYWFFVLINVLISVLLSFIDMITGSFSTEVGVGVLSGLYTLAIIIPSLAVSVRRLHDTGRSGWFLLLALIPIIGGIVLLIFFLLDSESEENTYGPNPKEVAVGSEV